LIAFGHQIQAQDLDFGARCPSTSSRYGSCGRIATHCGGRHHAP
jgi:hypothetical protein